MQKTKTTPLNINKPALAVSVLVVLITGLLLCWGLYAVVWSKKTVESERWWSVKSFDFSSGAACCVLPDQKITFFIGDGGDDEVFDTISSHGTCGVLASSTSASSASGGCDFTLANQYGTITLAWFNGKCVMEIPPHRAELTLADGRKFTLDGKTPLWLRCKSDGAVVKLDEPPKGFVEYFESPVFHGFNESLEESIKSCSDAFRKTK
jgi:hypothetical protein